MATEKTTLEILALLKAAFPDWARSQDDEQERASADLYLSRLRDVPDEILRETALAWIDRERFFPRVADLKAPAQRLQEKRHPSPDAAWQQCLAGTVVTRSIAEQVFHNLGLNRYDLGRMAYETVSVYQAQFLREYRDALSREQANAKLPQAVRTALPASLDSPALEDPATVAKRQKKAEEEAAARKWFREKAEGMEKPAQKPEPTPDQTKVVNIATAQAKKEMSLEERRALLKRQAALLQAREEEESA